MKAIALAQPKIATVRRASLRTARPSRLVVRAERDFDQILIDYANKFEKTENKVAVVGWGVAGLAAFAFTEWLIHLPGLNLLLGFPIQLIGVLVGPSLAYRYLVEKKDVVADFEGEVVKLTKDLPGLKKD